MGYVYTVIFLVGVIYTVVTFLMGGLLGLAHIDGHFDTHVDAGFHGHLDTHIDTHIDTGASPTFAVFPIKPITVVTFLTVFGGIGIIGTKEGINPILLPVMGALAGLFVSFILYRFIVIPLYKAQNTSAVTQDKLIGIKAMVISPIFEDGFGTIAYEVNGRKCNAPAQHVGKKAVAQGEEVIIYEIKNNVFYVEPLNLNDKAVL
jgi:hypothetical protein